MNRNKETSEAKSTTVTTLRVFLSLSHIIFPILAIECLYVRYRVLVCTRYFNKLFSLLDFVFRALFYSLLLFNWSHFVEHQRKTNLVENILKTLIQREKNSDVDWDEQVMQIHVCWIKKSTKTLQEQRNIFNITANKCDLLVILEVEKCIWPLAFFPTFPHKRV